MTADLSSGLHRSGGRLPWKLPLASLHTHIYVTFFVISFILLKTLLNFHLFQNTLKNSTKDTLIFCFAVLSSKSHVRGRANAITARCTSEHAVQVLSLVHEDMSSRLSNASSMQSDYSVKRDLNNFADMKN